MSEGLKIENAFIKAFTHKVGASKTKLTIIAALTPQMAQELRVRSVVFAPDNTPKQEIEEIKLKVIKSAPFDFRMEVPNIKDVLLIPSCIEAADWVAKLKGSTKKGKASRLLIEFKVAFNGAASGVFEWLEKYGQAIGSVTMKSSGPEQQDLKGEDVAAAAAEAAQKAARKGKANGAAAGSSSTVQ